MTLAHFFTSLPSFQMNIATFGGMLWYVIPMSVITINDIAAYMVGFFAGKTPLIKVFHLSTKLPFLSLTKLIITL